MGWGEKERKQNKIETHWENQKLVRNTSQEALRSILTLREFKTIAKDLGPFCCVLQPQAAYHLLLVLDLQSR